MRKDSNDLMKFTHFLRDKSKSKFLISEMKASPYIQIKLNEFDCFGMAVCMFSYENRDSENLISPVSPHRFR